MNTFCFSFLSYLMFFNFCIYFFLVGIPIGIATSEAKLQICTTTAGIRKYKSIIKKNENNHDKIVLLAKKLKTLEALISEALFDSYINHNQFVLVDNVLISE